MLLINEGSIFQIDFQLCCYCSPAVDLSYIFGMVKMDEDKNYPKEELITFYHQEFVKALTIFGYTKPPPTLLDINLEIMKNGKLNVLLAICFAPFAFIDWQTTTVDELFTTDSEKSRSVRRKLFEHPDCKALIQRDMKSWLHKGWLEI